MGMCHQFAITNPFTINLWFYGAAAILTAGRPADERALSALMGPRHSMWFTINRRRRLLAIQLLTIDRRLNSSWIKTFACRCVVGINYRRNGSNKNNRFVFIYYCIQRGVINVCQRCWWWSLDGHNILLLVVRSRGGISSSPSAIFSKVTKNLPKQCVARNIWMRPDVHSTLVGIGGQQRTATEWSKWLLNSRLKERFIRYGPGRDPSLIYGSISIRPSALRVEEMCVEYVTAEWIMEHSLWCISHNKYFISGQPRLPDWFTQQPPESIRREFCRGASICNIFLKRTKASSSTPAIFTACSWSYTFCLDQAALLSRGRATRYTIVFGQMCKN